MAEQLVAMTHTAAANRPDPGLITPQLAPNTPIDRGWD